MGSKRNSNRTRVALIAAWSFLALSPAVYAGEQPRCTDSLQEGAALTLSSAVETALCLNARTTTAWASIKIQTAQVDLARAAYLPTVNSSLTAQSNNTHYSGTTSEANRVNGFSSSLSLNWRLFDFGERAAQKAAAGNLLSAALASRDDAVRKTLSDTVSSYFFALQSRNTLDARKQASELSAKTLAAAQRRESRGVSGRSDTLQADAAQARARLAEQRAQADFDKAIVSLIYAMGARSDTLVLLPERMPAIPVQDLPDLEQLLADARIRHPAILAARAQRDASEDNVAAARANGRPTLDFSASNYRNGYPNQSVQSTRSNTMMVGVTLTIPLFDGFSRIAKIDQARAQAEKSAIQALDTEHQVLGELINSFTDVSASLKSMAASEQLLTAAQASLESANSRYEHGVADILELITAQNTLGEAREARAQCESQWNSARLKLMVDTGRVDRDQLLNPSFATAAP